MDNTSLCRLRPISENAKVNKLETKVFKKNRISRIAENLRHKLSATFFCFKLLFKRHVKYSIRGYLEPLDMASIGKMLGATNGAHGFRVLSQKCTA